MGEREGERDRQRGGGARLACVRFVPLYLPCFILAMFQFLYHAAPITAVSVNSAISNAGPLFTFVISAILLKEKVTVWKCLALGVALSGMVVVAFFGSRNQVPLYQTT